MSAGLAERRAVQKITGGDVAGEHRKMRCLQDRQRSDVGKERQEALLA